MQVFTVLVAIVLVSIIMNEAISACRYLKMEGSCMQVFTVLSNLLTRFEQAYNFGLIQRPSDLGAI